LFVINNRFSICEFNNRREISILATFENMHCLNDLLREGRAYVLSHAASYFAFCPNSLHSQATVVSMNALDRKSRSLLRELHPKTFLHFDHVFGIRGEEEFDSLPKNSTRRTGESAGFIAENSGFESSTTCIKRFENRKTMRLTKRDLCTKAIDSCLDLETSQYAKVLIQIGHEPFPPYPTRTLFGKPALALPNVFKYVAYINSVDGFTGCYRGLSPKLCASLVSGLTYQKVYESVKFEEERENDSEDKCSEEERRRKFFQGLARDIVCRAAAIVTSQPFTVIAVRMMAQFVGGEKRYLGLFSSIREIYNENGLPGFFSGLVPRVLGEVISLIMASSLTYTVNRYIIEDRELRTYSAASMTFIVGAITYPFQVVSNCMAVTDSGLIAGKPPHMPIYTTWTDCWSHLSRTNQLKRGSSLLFRYYTGPQIEIQGRSVALDKNDFQRNYQ
ncbi:hypothetical protein L9F63_008205, partial [Diploptera punctata]